MTSPCENLKRAWEWKKGDQYPDATTNIAFNRNYFDCGTYYFDGTFNVVKFPPGISLYHGSANLANSLSEFPVGINFYKPYDLGGKSNIEIKPPINSPEFMNVVANSDESIEEIISRSIPITAGWYADPGVARLYSGTSDNPRLGAACEGRCINAYKTTKETVFFLLDDDYNIAKLFSSDTRTVPEEKKDQLMKMFDIKNRTPIKTGNANPFQRLRYDKQRVSKRAWDLPFASWICDVLVKHLPYAGYAATVQFSKAHGGTFHLEFMFCDAFKYMERDLTNILDWQHRPNKYPEGAVKIFMEQLSLYQCVNVNFHAGNLLEHSIWTLLFAEKIMKDRMLKPPFEDDKLFRTIAFAAFIHDIGKMSPDHARKNTERDKFIYFAVKTHPDIGYDYIVGAKKLPVFDEKLRVTGKLDIDNLFRAFGIDLENKEAVAAAVKLHWDFGAVLKNFNADSRADKLEYYSDIYMKKVGRVFNKGGRDLMRAFFYMLLVISIADINGAQPYGEGRLSTQAGSIELNKSSEFFPFLTNMPKQYRGGNIVQVSGINTAGAQLAGHILGRIYS